MQIVTVTQLSEVFILKPFYYEPRYRVKVTQLLLTDPQMDGPITIYPNSKARSLIKPWSIKNGEMSFVPRTDG